MLLLVCMRFMSFQKAYLRERGQSKECSRYSRPKSCSQEHIWLPFHHFLILFWEAVSAIILVSQQRGLT